jgi:hypothetical protein
MKQINIFGEIKERTWFEDNLKQIKIGLEGESQIRKMLSKKNIRFMQADLIFNHNNQYYCAEVKTQEKYLAPPFDGHGLPMWQITARIELFNKTGIVPYLFIRCLTDNLVYHQDLRELMQTEYYQTKGKSPRVIFNLSEFKKSNIE